MSAIIYNNALCYNIFLGPMGNWRKKKRKWQKSVNISESFESKCRNVVASNVT